MIERISLCQVKQRWKSKNAKSVIMKRAVTRPNVMVELELITKL